MRKSANMFRLPMHSVVDTLSNAQPSDWTAVGGKAKASRCPDVLSPEEVGWEPAKEIGGRQEGEPTVPISSMLLLADVQHWTRATITTTSTSSTSAHSLQLHLCFSVFPGREKQGDYSVFESRCHVPTCLPRTVLASRCPLFMLNVKQRSCECQLIFVVWLTSVSWSSGNAFVSGAGGLGFKSRAGQIGHSVANSSPLLQHFFERRSCVPGRNDVEMVP